MAVVWHWAQTTLLHRSNLQDVRDQPEEAARPSVMPDQGTRASTSTWATMVSLRRPAVAPAAAGIRPAGGRRPSWGEPKVSRRTWEPPDNLDAALRTERFRRSSAGLGVSSSQIPTFPSLPSFFPRISFWVPTIGFWVPLVIFGSRNQFLSSLGDFGFPPRYLGFLPFCLFPFVVLAYSKQLR